MSKGDFLGEFEFLVLAALNQLGDEAYAAAVRLQIESRTERRVAIGAVHATLDRLEKKGYVRFKVLPPRPIPGGRARRAALVTAAGTRALTQTVQRMERMIAGLRIRDGRVS